MVNRLWIVFCGFIIICSSLACSNSTNGGIHEDSVSVRGGIEEAEEKPVSEMTQEEILNSKRFKEKMRELAPVYAEQKVKFKMLCSEWSRCKTANEKRQFIRDNEYEVGEYFDVDISTIAKAENLFVTHPEEFMKAMELKLQARAAKELAEESYQRAYELRYSE